MQSTENITFIIIGSNFNVFLVINVDKTVVSINGETINNSNFSLRLKYLSRALIRCCDPNESFTFTVNQRL